MTDIVKLAEIRSAAENARRHGLPTVHHSCASPGAILLLVEIVEAALAYDMAVRSYEAWTGDYETTLVTRAAYRTALARVSP